MIVSNNECTPGLASRAESVTMGWPNGGGLCCATRGSSKASPAGLGRTGRSCGRVLREVQEGAGKVRVRASAGVRTCGGGLGGRAAALGGVAAHRASIFLPFLTAS